MPRTSSALLDPPLPPPGPSLRREAASPATGLVRRERLVGTLAATDAPVALLVAPAGYGKTVLLEAWAQADPRPFAWIRLGHASVGAAALRREAFARLEALRAEGLPFVLVVEDIEGVRGPEASGVLEALVRGLPPGAMLALSARAEPCLPIGRLRAHRQLVELRPRELAMTRGEAAALLAAAGTPLDAAGVEAVVGRAEGWAAGLYIAAVAIVAQGATPDAITGFSGADRMVADYLRDEFLTQLPPSGADFLMRASMLDPLSGPLCDAVLGRSDSGIVLRDFGRSEQLVTAIDRREERFRLHPLLADMLRAELHRAHPVLEAELHCRASAWYEEQGELGLAIEHAVDGRDFERAGELLWQVAPTQAWGSRKAVLEAWLARIPDHQLKRRPRLALTAAASCFAAGRRDEMDRWTATAERHGVEAPPRERAVVEAGVAVMRSAAARDGAAEMRRQAARAAALVPDDSPWRAVGGLLEGSALVLCGELEAGREALEDGAHRAADIAPGIEALCLAQLALVSLFADDWEQGATLAERARTRARALPVDDHPTLALVCAASAFARAYRGRLDDARSDVATARRLLEALDGFAPWHEAPARLALARAQLRLSNVAEARGLIAEAAKVAQRIPEAELLRGWLEDAWARADTFAVDALSGASSLTTAELRVLRWLPSHLSMREIAERLHVSANTVKTQAHAAYRKLDACSRSGAVDRARQLGLLDR